MQSKMHRTLTGQFVSEWSILKGFRQKKTTRMNLSERNKSCESHIDTALKIDINKQLNIYFNIISIKIHAFVFIFNMNIFYIFLFLYLDTPEVYQNNRKIHLFDVVVF